MCASSGRMSIYEHKAKTLDKPPPEGYGTSPSCSLFLGRLRQLKPVRGLIIGNYGEVSRDVNYLLSSIAERMAERSWRTAGARSNEEFSSSCLNTVRGRFGIAAVRAFARHCLNRLRWVGASRREIEKVIAEANAAQAQKQTRRAHILACNG